MKFFLWIVPLFLFSCTAKNDRLLDSIYKSLKSENVIKDTSTLYVIQDNSCISCFENLFFKAKKDSQVKVVILSLNKRTSLKNTINRLSTYVKPERISVITNKLLQENLIKYAGGFSKGFYQITLDSSKSKILTIKVLN